VFGGVRRQVEAASAQAEAQRFVLEATYLTLTSNIALAAIQEASLRAQLQETHDAIWAERQLLLAKDKKTTPKMTLSKQRQGIGLLWKRPFARLSRQNRS
jgi:hypothetical protein